MIAVAKVALPDFGRARTQPKIPLDTYKARLAATIDRMGRDGLDYLVVYGDREHCANMLYLVGMAPRFEEALLLLDRKGHGLLLLGNECLAAAPNAGLGVDVELYQDFSLMGQPRGNSRPLRDILSSVGIGRGAKVGCVGWKYYDAHLTGETRYANDLPAYIVDLLRDLTGDRSAVTNAGGIFVNPADGLRIVNMEPEQIAAFEYAAVQTSMAVLAVLRHMKEGSREDKLEKYLDGAGLPRSCHPLIAFGESLKRGLPSPSANRAALGDMFGIGFGLIGSLTCRAGAVAQGPQDLPEACRDFYPRFAANYFDVVSTWYEQLQLGVTAGEVYSTVDARRNDSIFKFALNPGHYIHLDEWTHSPFVPGSTVKIESGMALQADIIPVSKGPFCFIDAEDGVVLADEALRSAVARKFPACWRRIQARREFMTTALGIRLDESVLPLSNTPAWLPPYALSLGNVFVRE